MFSELKNGHSRKALVPAGHSYRECQTPLEWHDVRSVHSHSIHAQCRLPDVLMVHLGGNDLGVVTLLDVVIQFKKGLRFIKQMFKNISLVWSSVVPRKM